MEIDEAEQRELRLRRDSQDLLTELERKIPRLLGKSVSGARSRINLTSTNALKYCTIETRKVQYVNNLLEPFQEWPQLLDPYLASIMKELVSTLLNCVDNSADENAHRDPGVLDPKYIPLSQGICKIICVLCKVRGHKVIAQLLSNEAQHFNKILCASEAQSRVQNGPFAVSWEERYVILLWLSHLLLVPFDLSSLSSDRASSFVGFDFLGLSINENVPVFAKRLLSVSLPFLNVASKEREAATSILVRLSLRKDMGAIGLRRSVIEWVLRGLRVDRTTESSATDYHFLGLLTLLASFIKSSSTAILQPYLWTVMREVENIPMPAESSATARKLMVKIYRGLTIQCVTTQGENDNFIEKAIEYIVEQLARNDTSVRFAASKALAMIAAKTLAIAADVLELLLADLNEDVEIDHAIAVAAGSKQQNADQYHSNSLDWQNQPKKLYSRVNGTYWHGLVLTLSFFALQRSIPPEMLAPTLSKLVDALSFEQKTPLGASVGTNVRDAACLGLWALVRKSSTNEICRASDLGKKTLQAIACELVVAAALDPVGNIRRAASAALQETIGRHPNTINCGNSLELIQIVDYHAISLRSKALTQAALRAAAIDKAYFKAILAGLLSWRCLRFEDVASRREFAAQNRRDSARATGQMALLQTCSFSKDVIEAVLLEFSLPRNLNPRDLHGLLYASAEIVSHLHDASHEKLVGVSEEANRNDMEKFWNVLLPDNTKLTYDKDEDEARAALLAALAESASCPQRHHFAQVPLPPLETVHACITWIDKIVKTQSKWDRSIVGASAFRSLMCLLDSEESVQIISRLIDETSSLSSSQKTGQVQALAAAFRLIGNDRPEDTECRDRLIRLVLQEIATGNSINERVNAISSLEQGILEAKVCTTAIAEAILSSLQDYTIDERGDVGSLVRIQAIKAASTAIRERIIPEEHQQRHLTGVLCGLATEKLDRVRFQAGRCLQSYSSELGLDSLFILNVTDTASVSEAAYFEQILSLSSQDWIRRPLLEGIVTTAGAGSESLVVACRLALTTFLKKLSQHKLERACRCLMEILHDRITDDRIAVPTMETIAFMFETGEMARLTDDIFNWKALFNLVAKAHYKSTNLRRIEAAVNVYRGLATIPESRSYTVSKLISLLRHRYAIIRNRAADALLVLEGPSEPLLTTDWSETPTALAAPAEAVRLLLAPQ